MKINHNVAEETKAQNFTKCLPTVNNQRTLPLIEYIKKFVHLLTVNHARLPNKKMRYELPWIMFFLLYKVSPLKWTIKINNNKAYKKNHNNHKTHKYRSLYIILPPLQTAILNTFHHSSHKLMWQMWLSATSV